MSETAPPGDDRPGKPSGRSAGSEDRPPSCPRCASEEVRKVASRLVYDRPGLDFEVYHLGGCVIPSDRWQCEDCGREW